MLNEGRIKAMTNMAMYEDGPGKEDIRISSYYKSDYISLNVLWTIIWAFVGYVFVLGIYAVMNLESILDNLNLEAMTQLGIIAGGGLGIVLVVFGVFSGIYYNRRYNTAKQNAKRYYRELGRLNKMYEREK